MKHLLLIPLAATILVATHTHTFAQDRIYRCGNEYTNNANEAASRGCKLVEGGNVTVVQGTKPSGPPSAGPAPVRVATAGQSGQRVDSGEQRARDSDARAILESELKKTETRQAELLKEFNNGEPEKRGDEARNYQKYLDRVAELKASIARNDSDIAGLKRELGRAPAATTTRQ
ncbi:MAG: hypothetical protein EOO28_16775 [Comamonadaceae bacterium]|nr:MAG: hypothetical protein EOO28_16775 [Comamonadaceae bacterium]